MKKVYLPLLITVMVLFTGMKAFAYDCEVDGIYYYRISATELEVANKVFSDQNRTAYTSSVSIPATVTYMGKTFNVVSIGEYAFRDCASLTSISIPSSVKTIKSYAFFNCSQISNINLPSGLKSLGEGAFEGCTALTSMLIPTGVPEIEDETFYGCTSMKTIILPGSINSIGLGAFARCTSLLSIYMFGVTSPSCEPSAFDKVDRTWCTLYVPKSGKGYQENEVWKEFFIEEFEGKMEDIPMNTPTK